MDITDAQFAEAIAMLENKATKKSVCEYLNITYNVKRLAKLIEEWQKRQEVILNMRKKLRGTPLSKQEKSSIVQDKLTGNTVSEIAKSHYRSVDLVKEFLSYETPLPLKDEADYKDPSEIPAEFLKDEYRKGDIVYSAAYGEAAEVKSEHSEGVYSIYLLKSCKNAYQPYYELGDLSSICSEYNIKVTAAYPGVKAADKVVRGRL